MHAHTPFNKNLFHEQHIICINLSPWIWVAKTTKKTMKKHDYENQIPWQTSNIIKTPCIQLTFHHHHGDVKFAQGTEWNNHQQFDDQPLPVLPGTNGNSQRWWLTTIHLISVSPWMSATHFDHHPCTLPIVEGGGSNYLFYHAVSSRTWAFFWGPWTDLLFGMRW